MISFKRPKKESFRLDITPLINIVFLLLIFFMLSSAGVNQGLNVQLPDAETSEKINSQQVTVSIAEDGRIMTDNQLMTLDELEPKLRVMLANRPKKTVEIHGDAGIEYELFGKVIDRARLAGATGFTIATDHMEPDEDDIVVTDS